MDSAARGDGEKHLKGTTKDKKRKTLLCGELRQRYSVWPFPGATREGRRNLGF